jgi:DNA repair protein RadC
VKRPTDPRQITLLPPDAAAIIHLVRENLRVLRELVQRYEVPWLDAAGEQLTVRAPADVAAYLGPEMGQLAQEQLRVVLLDTKNHVLASVLVYQGGINSIAVRPADCFREAVRTGAASVIVVHNHPSGDPTPSAEDVRLTRDVGQVGELLGVEVLDHLVVAGDRHVSLRERGLYTPPTPAHG